MKKKVLKGFTLIELIIVMAIFSLLMLGAMSLVDPVSKIYKHSNDFERTYSYVDNIQNYLQGSLQYADNIWIYQGNMTDDQIRSEMLEYKEAFYKDIITTSNGSTVKPANCTLRVMTILNSDLPADVDNSGYIDSGEAYPKGQILMRDVTLASDVTVLPALSAYKPQLNETYFGGKYSYDYVLGASTFVRVGDSSMINSLAPSADGTNPGNIDNVVNGLQSPSNFAIGIVTYDTTDNKDGTPKVTDVSATKIDGSPYVYRTYDPASQYSIANIPLINIINRNGQLNQEYFVYGRFDTTNLYDTSVVKNYPGDWYDIGGTGTTHPSSDHSVLEADAANISLNANDNIYIIYALSDEVNVPQP